MSPENALSRMWFRHEVWETPSLPSCPSLNGGLLTFPQSQAMMSLPSRAWERICRASSGPESVYPPDTGKETVNEVMSAMSSCLLTPSASVPKSILTPSALSFGTDDSSGGEARKGMVIGRSHEGTLQKGPLPYCFFLLSLPLFLFEVYWHITLY